MYKSCASGKILFSSKDKFQTGRGRPSFYKPVDEKVLNEIGKPKDRIPLIRSMMRGRVESKEDEVHLGYVFNDAPLDKGGFRYTVNSAVLDFVPYDQHRTLLPLCL